MSRIGFCAVIVLLCCAGGGFFTGCAPSTRTASLPVDTAAAFSYTGKEAVPDKWWTVFENQPLNALMDSSLETNFDLAVAWNRLRAARAIVRRESASLFPTLDATAQAETGRSPQDIGEPADERRETRFWLGLGAGYEIDLWGRIGAIAQAERFRAEATLAEYHAATLSVSAEIASAWFQLMEAGSQLELVDEQINTNEQILNLIRVRFGSGQTRSVDILRQRQLVEATREQKFRIESRIEVLEHQLAALAGFPPQLEFAYARQPLPELPPLPETGIPAGLVERRPDVRSAFYFLRAADRDAAAAISAQYPRLSISATLSTSAYNARNLFNDWAASFAGNLMAPLFYGGELRAEADRARALQDQRLYEYGQAILNAFHEVEDALAREVKQRDVIASIEEQVELARTAYEQLRVEYFNGMADYLDVLTALDEEQQLRRNLLSARLSLLDYRISLYRFPKYAG